MFLKSNGQYIGTLVRGAGETFNLFVPVRRIHEWAKTHHVEFIFDPKAKPDFSKVKLEDKEPMPKKDPEVEGLGSRTMLSTLPGAAQPKT